MTTRIRRHGDEESAATVVDEDSFVEFDLGRRGRIRATVETRMDAQGRHLGDQTYVRLVRVGSPRSPSVRAEAANVLAVGLEE